MALLSLHVSLLEGNYSIIDERIWAAIQTHLEAVEWEERLLGK